jgi:Flp pilus assembly pilin Flp
MSLINRLWTDQAGFVVSTELVLIATILVIGMIVGLTSVRDQVVQELGDIAAAISQVNQSYSWSAVTGHHSSTAGSLFADLTDSCDATPDTADAPPLCIAVCTVAATAEGTGT